MDPNETLRLIRDLINEINSGAPDSYDSSTWSQTLYNLSEHIEALDDWLTKGGFLPQPWWTSGVTFVENADSPQACLHCLKNEARYLSGLCGLCDMKAGTGCKLLRDASINDLRIARAAMGNAIKTAQGEIDG